MKFKRLLALLLSGMLLTTSVSFTAFAAEAKAEETEEEENKVAALADYTSIEYSSPQEKLATMKLRLENDKYQLWALEETGEIAFVTKATGQILFSNPYDVASMSKDAKSTETKKKILSQLQLRYSNGANEALMNTYNDAALNRQISMEPIRGGLRVNYTMGREEARILVPEMIEKSRFEEEILAKMPEKDPETGRTFVDPFVNKNPYRYMEAYFSLKDPNSEKLSQTSKEQMMQTFPITKKYAIYILSSDTSTKEKKNLEHLIQTYTDYTFDDMEADHQKVEYESRLASLPLFKVAIEYYLDDDGLRVRVPASDIRFNSSAFSLKAITVLPYFGAGTVSELGYTLISDGSGSLVRFEDVAQSNIELTITSKVYGQDYSFHQISGQNQEVMRIPAFGVIRNMSYPTFDKDAYDAAIESGELIAYDDIEGQKAAAKAAAEAEAAAAEAAKNAPKEEPKVEAEENTAEEAATDATEGEAVEGTEGETVEEEPVVVNENLAQSGAYVNFDDVKEETSGYVAYVEEGESLAEITTAHGGVVHRYNSAYATFNPKPTDSYQLTGVSATGNATWSVTAERKYTGNFTIRYIPVSDEKATTAGMAEAIRDYLVKKGVLTKLVDDGNKNIPLYLETFGSIKTTQRFAGVPFDVQTPLTTFEDAQEMITELQTGVTVDAETANERVLKIPNIVIKYTGWYNGGLYKTVPKKIKVDKAIGGADGLKSLVDFANSNGVKVFPDVEYSYINNTAFGDGFNYKDDAVQTIDGRTAVHKKYSALYQMFEPDGQLILSPTAMTKYYEKSGKKYTDLGVGAISVATLGSDLYSDHNDDYPLTREDSKETLTTLLSKMKEDNGEVLVSGGNAYALPYVDHILDIPLTSSENVFATEAVPFYGMILHGYKSFAGTAINLDGDYEKSVLKAIENGASPYFILSARSENTSELKSFVDFSKFYSIRYNIWKEDLVKTYNQLNDALGSVKYETITDHKYLDTRVVRVDYSNGEYFILNYNTIPVEIDGVEIEPMGFVKKSVNN